MSRCKANPCCSNPYNCEIPIPQHASGMHWLNPQVSPFQAELMAEERELVLAKFDSLVPEIRERFIKALDKHQAYPSIHHGYGVMVEEMDEVLDEVRSGNQVKLRDEALDVIAASVRLIIDRL